MAPLQTLGSFYRTLIDRFKEAGLEIPDLAARRILSERLKMEWGDFITRADMPVLNEDIAVINKDAARYLAGEPLSKIYGKTEFYGFEFEINAHVLDPRPDTEMLIEYCLKQYEGRKEPSRLIDLGAGSGCIGLTLAKFWPDVQVLAIDISNKALAVTQKNAEKLGLERRVKTVCSDWLQQVTLKQGDLVIANPPYIRSDVIPELSESVRNFDPILALDGGVDGIRPYEIIFSQILQQKKSKKIGVIRGLFEIGFDQEHDIKRIAEKYRIRVKDVIFDYAGNPRVVDIYFE